MNDSNNLMGREDLLKLAALDVFGLLDSYESDLFNRSFHDASASVQDEVVLLQASLASDTTFLSGEEPSPELRAKVLARIADAVEQEAARLAPIPLYRGRGMESDRHQRQVRRLERATIVWRAASFVLAACLLIMVVLFVKESQRSSHIAELALNRVAQDQLTEVIGDNWREYLGHPAANVVAMLPEQGSTFQGGALVFVNPQAGSVFVLGLALPKEGTYRLIATDDSGDVLIESAPFNGNGAVAAAQVEGVGAVARLANASWRLVDEATGIAVLTA